LTDRQDVSARRVTLADVAKRAGVSTALASIVMRDAPGASPASRRRIHAVARELGYRPDVRARSLASRTPHLIGVLFGTAGRFQFELIDGLYSAAEGQGWDLVLSALTGGRDERRALQSLQDFRLDALVMLGPPVAEPVLAGEVPLAVLGWHVDHPDVDVVRTSDELGMALAVRHLVDHGHRHIAHLQGGTGLLARARKEAYAEAMRAEGLAAETRVVLCDGEDQVHGQRAVSAMLKGRPELPTALVAFNDDIAAAAISVLAQHGTDVPGTVSVTGFDDSALARSPGVDLTTVQQDPREMARLAVERIIARCAGAHVADREIVLGPRLQARSTTGPAPTTGRRRPPPHLAAARDD
jgi:DNA-binding LacI/PurR family transcriptional regulator